MSYDRLQATSICACADCSTIFRRGPHMFFNEAPEHYEQSVCSRKCPNCQKYTAEIANDAAIAYFNYVFGKNHGIIYKSDLEALTASERVDLFRKKVVVA